VTDATENDTPEVEAKEPDPVVEIVEKPEKREVDGIDQLKAQIEAEKKGRLEAEQRAREAALQTHRAKIEVSDTNLRLIESAIDTLKNDAENLEVAYATAMANGDYAQGAKIQRAMAQNEHKLMQLEGGKEEMSAQIAAAQKTPPPPADPVEALASQLHPRSAAWVRAHPDYVKGTKYNAMIGAHQVAVDKGIEPDTDEYFAEVERILGLDGSPRRVSRSFDDDDAGDDPMSGAAKSVSRSSPPPAAPVSRSGGAPGNSPRVIRLTKEQAEIAKMNQMSEKEYYEQLQRARKAGEIH
jgi:hypothetical protein